MSRWPAGRWREPVAALACLSRGGSSSVCGAEPRTARAPPVGCGSAAVESVWSAGQADWGLPICPKPHAPTPQQGLCSSQVCDKPHYLCCTSSDVTALELPDILIYLKWLVHSFLLVTFAVCSFSGRGGQIYLGAHARSCPSPSSTTSVLS